MKLARGQEIPDEMILQRMETGDKLTVARLAARLNMSPEKVRMKLLDMVAQGKIKREREGKSMSMAYLYFVDRVRIIAGGAYEIPTPFVGVNLTGDLVGYAQEMNARAALCMSIRRVA
ncbi:hypothetical protein IAG25_35450 [Caballeronia sp. EK]|uniref:hypothetical protein n=1 Tax=Caballeronia sp. EK TaxID=2767469 RepID=UPI001655557B|nr:hypothetical protein [Caballeronia sp. EK]MBC8642104.1 hypothetical protein [Caballeronia sp. EK]